MNQILIFTFAIIIGLVAAQIYVIVKVGLLLTPEGLPRWVKALSIPEVNPRSLPKRNGVKG